MSLRSRKKAEKEHAIIEAATDLFREQGFEATRTADIAARAGIATGTLFNYAPNKRAVVVLIWKHRVKQLVETVLAAGLAAEGPLDTVEAVFRPIFAFYDEDRELGRVFLQAVMYDGDADDEMRSLNQGFVGRLALVLVPYTRDPLAAAMNVFSAYYTVLTMLLAGQLADVDAAVQMLRSLVAAQRDGWSGSG